MQLGRRKRLTRLSVHVDYAQAEAEHLHARREARRNFLDVVRYALTELGIDPMSVQSVRRIEADLAEEETTPPPTASRPEDPRDQFFAEIDRIAERYLAKPDINFDSASLVEVFAWCIAQHTLRHPPPADPAPGDASDFAADSLQEQQKSQFRNPSGASSVEGEEWQGGGPS